MYQIQNTGDYVLEATEPIVTDASETMVGQDFHGTGVKLVSFEDVGVFDAADCIILAIPSGRPLEEFVKNNIDRLQNSILIDVTNPVPYENTLSDVLQKIGLQDDRIRWVKAFNDNGAIDLLGQKPSRKTEIPTTICGPDQEAVMVVKHFAEECLGFHAKVVPYTQWDQVARHQQDLGQQWLHSAAILFVIFILAEIYALVRYNVKKGYDWSHLPLQVTNKAVCWTAIYGFALTQLPGTLTKLIRIFRSDTLRDLHPILLFGLRIRKQLGVLSLYYLTVHVLMSLLIFNPSYYGKFFSDPSAKSSKFTTKAEISFFFGIVGFSFYLILGICSLPSVVANLTKHQFSLLYGSLVWMALIFGTIHVMVMGVAGWSKQETWPGNMPPITLLSVVVPLFVLFLKFVQVNLSFFLRLSKKVHYYEARVHDSTERV
eukprot:CAMPEP_0197715748 /NCGR_PEP_ID=MMETSP1434-20131217/859_1 /TAXON_ID=265543 /ORGANISM="Minutocellus polymorphus, Strain CCMP3303" /LENGTH=429 /DNA_ID=CAMNT_0043299963 /DNA_START=33 /DNA_END=1322 /DNA_ORIENTATION=-